MAGLEDFLVTVISADDGDKIPEYTHVQYHCNIKTFKFLLSYDNCVSWMSKLKFRVFDLIENKQDW